MHRRKHLGFDEDLAFVECSPFNANVFTLPTSFWSEPQRAKVTQALLTRELCDATLWSTVRWAMRGMLREYDFASFYFDFRTEEQGQEQDQEDDQSADLCALLWEPKSESL